PPNSATTWKSWTCAAWCPSTTPPCWPASSVPAVPSWSTRPPGSPGSAPRSPLGYQSAASTGSKPRCCESPDWTSPTRRRSSNTGIFRASTACWTRWNAPCPPEPGLSPGPRLGIVRCRPRSRHVPADRVEPADRRVRSHPEDDGEHFGREDPLRRIGEDRLGQAVLLTGPVLDLQAHLRHVRVLARPRSPAAGRENPLDPGRRQVTRARGVLSRRFGIPNAQQ